jgi:RNA-splicing ligase RtcB
VNGSLWEWLPERAAAYDKIRATTITPNNRGIAPTELWQQLKSRGIVARAGSTSGLAEEAPTAYKDVSRVVDVVHKAGIAKKIARLEPIAVIKG